MKLRHLEGCRYAGADNWPSVGERGPVKVELVANGKVEGLQFCFTAGTLVHTKNGMVSIEQIKVGDWVLSRRDNNTGKQAYKRVLKTIQSDETKPIIMLVTV